MALARHRIEDLSIYGWDIASLPNPALLELETEIASLFPWGDTVPIVTCQRYEVLSLGSPLMDAPRAYHGQEALLHLARLAAGLESLVLGEAEILGQVRTALSAGSPELRHLTAPAIAAARLLKREEGFNDHAGFALDSALEMGNLPAEGSVLVIGGGPMGRRAAERALALGFDEVTVVARKPLALPEPISYRPFSALASLPPSDVLVACLGRSAPQMGRDQLPTVRRLAIDLATPRNLRSDLSVPVINLAMLLNHLRESSEQAAERDRLASRLAEILASRLNVPDGDSPIGSLREEVERIRQRELLRSLRLHPELPLEKIDTITRSLVNQIFHRPSQRLRDADDPELAAAVAALFSTRTQEEVDDGG